MCVRVLIERARRRQDERGYVKSFRDNSITLAIESYHYQPQSVFGAWLAPHRGLADRCFSYVCFRIKPLFEQQMGKNCRRHKTI